MPIRAGAPGLELELMWMLERLQTQALAPEREKERTRAPARAPARVRAVEGGRGRWWPPESTRRRTPAFPQWPGT